MRDDIIMNKVFKQGGQDGKVQSKLSEKASGLRRASQERSAPRGSRSEAPISPSRTEGFGFRVGEDARSD